MLCFTSPTTSSRPIVILCWAICFSLLLATSHGLNVVNATYQTKKVTFLGVPVTLREFEVKFDEEIYHLQADFPCPNVRCAAELSSAASNEAAYTCDPTQEGWCNATFIKNNTECNPYRELLCRDEEPIYKVLKFGETTHEEIATGTEKYYVYRTMEPCKYLTYRADPLYGDPNLFIYHLEDFAGYLSGLFHNQRPMREGGFFGPDRFSVCPGQTDYPFKLGTHVIVAYPFDSLITATGPSGTQFTLQVDLKQLPPASTAVPCSVPEEAANWKEPTGEAVPGKWQCLTDGIASNFTSKSGKQIRYYVYTVPAGSVCQHIYWYHWSYAIYIGYALGDDVKVPYENTGYVATDWNLVSFTGNPKGDFVLACPTAEHAFHLLIKVQPNPKEIARTEEADFNMVYVDSSFAYRWTEKIADKNHYVATWDLQMSSQLVCKRRDGSRTKRQCNFRLDTNDDASECSRFWHYYPSDIPIPIFPLNTWLFGDSRFVNFNPKIASPPSDGYSYLAAALIDYQPDLTQAPINAYENTEALLDTCEIVFMGSIVDFNGVPLPPTPVPIHPRSIECRYQEYLNKIVPEMMRLSKHTREAAGAVDVRDYRVAMDILAYSSYYYDCLAFADQLVQLTPVTRTISSTFCNPEQIDHRDPCCNASLNFYNYECVSRKLSYSVQKFDRLSKLGESSCSFDGSAQCSSLFVADYVVASENARSSLEGCGVNTPSIDTYVGRNMRTFRNISDRWFGSDPDAGHLCSSDDDCTLFSNSRCDLLKGSCLYPIDKLVYGFLQDWLPTLPYLLKNITANGIAESMNSSAFNTEDIDAWMNILSNSSSDCTGTYDWGFGYRQSYGRAITLEVYQDVCGNGENTAGENYCPPRFCFSSSCTVEFECQLALGANSACWTTFGVLKLPSDCLAEQEKRKICNWTPSYTRTNFLSVAKPANFSCFDESSICAVCETDDRPCLGFPGLHDPCEGRFACFLNNGSVVVTASEADCQMWMTCNATCYANAMNVPQGETPSVVPCTQEQCESGTAGLCDSHVWSFKSDNTYRPACIVPPTLLWGDCPSMPGIQPLEFGRSTPYGCIYYQNVTANCEHYGPQAKPYFTPITKSDCLRAQACWQIWDDDNFRNDYTFTLKGPESCTSVGGEIKSYSKWYPATWRGGIARPLTTLTANSSVIRFPKKNTINLIALTSRFKKAIETAYSILQRTETFCRYNPIVRSLTPILCQCSPDGVRSSECFPPPENAANSKDTAAASFTICQGYGTVEQRAAPLTISFDRSTITGCHPATVNPFPASIYAKSSTEALSTFLLDFSTSKPYQFPNKHGALTAQIISDGVILTSDFNMTHITMCINPRLDIVVNNSQYTVFDFASVDFSSPNAKPEILFVEGAQRDAALDAVCGYFSYLDTSRAYFAIARTEDAASRHKNYFPTGETVFYAFMCGIYGIISLLAAFRFIAAILAGQLVPRNTQVWIFLTISVMLFLRWLYLVLILLGVVVGNSSSAIDYFLVELPSFLYLTIMTFFIIIWATLIKANRTLTKRQNNSNFWIVFGILNGVIYLIFLILIIIYEAVRPKSKFDCGGRLVRLDQKVRQRTAIAYRAILATFALAVSLAFFITGISIYRSLKANSNQRSTRKRKIFWLTSVCSVGLMALSTLLIVLATTGLKNNFLALGLLVLFEAVPCSLIIFALWKVESKDTMAGNKRPGASDNSEAMQPLRYYGKAESASKAAPWANR